MLNTEHNLVTSAPKANIREENSQEMSILVQKLLGNDSSQDFTKEQVDEILSQKREITGYIHSDKAQESWDNKFYLVVIILFVMSFSGLILWANPQYFDQVLGFLAGAFGGGLGGYGLASKKK